MPTIPILSSGRLVLRPFREDDALSIEPLLATPDVAQYTLSFTHPLPPDAALEWVRRRLDWAEAGVNPQWAITLRGDRLIGAIGLHALDDRPAAEMGFWLGPDFWNHGYATEAARAVIAYGFDVLRLPRIEASCFVENIASARVLEKAGMVFESVLPGGVVKDGRPRDVRLYAITGRNPD